MTFLRSLRVLPNGGSEVDTPIRFLFLSVFLRVISASPLLRGEIAFGPSYSCVTPDERSSPKLTGVCRLVAALASCPFKFQFHDMKLTGYQQFGPNCPKKRRQGRDGAVPLRRHFDTAENPGHSGRNYFFNRRFAESKTTYRHPRSPDITAVAILSARFKSGRD
jgi:hypothetical protein